MTDTATVIVPSDPATRKELFQFVKNASDSLARIDSEKEHLKALKDEVKEKFEIPTKFFNKLVKTYHKDSHSKEQQEAADFDELYTAVVLETSKTSP